MTVKSHQDRHKQKDHVYDFIENISNDFMCKFILSVNIISIIEIKL
jgi:hypothetical protein